MIGEALIIGLQLVILCATARDKQTEKTEEPKAEKIEKPKRKLVMNKDTKVAEADSLYRTKMKNESYLFRLAVIRHGTRSAIRAMCTTATSC